MSNTVVATNTLALNSYRNLKQVGSRQSQASARLSSGYKINSAADDAAGLAISEKMRAQIRGLDMASKNTQDAISLIQTAEGGMQEIDNMIQRIRELTVQAGNDTNEHNSTGTGDRQKIQDEINQLVEEIDSMADRVEFNKKTVLNGTYEAIPTSGSSAGDLKTAKADLRAAQNTYVGAEQSLDQAAKGITSAKAGFQSLFTDPEISKKLFNLTGFYSSEVSDLEAAITTFTSNAAYTGGITDKADVTTLVGLYSDITSAVTDLKTAASGNADSSYVDLALDGALDLLNGVGTAYDNYTAKEGELTTAATGLADAKVAYATVKAEYDAAEKTPGLFFQVGANANQGMNLSIASVKSDRLGIGNGNGVSNINVLEASGADITASLETLDEALSYVTTERSRLGAAQNRLEYTMKSLDISSENISAAESRIRDTDMAKEMMKLTQANVLNQAGIAMLAQANQSPQGVLQLLQ